MSFGHALYYPHISLTNKNWVKHSLLFWDRLSRIIPTSVEPSDNEDIIKIRYESDFISDYHPEKWDVSQAFNSFGQKMRDVIESDRFFNDRFFRREYNSNYNYQYENKRNLFSELAQSSGTYIHVQKMDSRLKEYLFETGVAVPGRNQWEDWVRIDSEIGLLYMTFFAKTISKNKTLPIVTDVEQSFAASIYFESSINSDYREQFEYKLGNLLIKSVVPKNINDVPLDVILEIRRKYDDERVAFFDQISTVTNDVAEIDNPSALNDALRHHSKIILRETKKLEKLYRSHRIETANKFLSLSIPSVLASSLVPVIATPFVAAAGVAFGIISAANSVKKEKLELQANPKSYLLNLKSELQANDILHRINDSVAGLRKW